jgi:hypothetical protein
LEAIQAATLVLLLLGCGTIAAPTVLDLAAEKVREYAAAHPKLSLGSGEVDEEASEIELQAPFIGERPRAWRRSLAAGLGAFLKWDGKAPVRYRLTGRIDAIDFAVFPCAIVLVFVGCPTSSWDVELNLEIEFRPPDLAPGRA